MDSSFKAGIGGGIIIGVFGVIVLLIFIGFCVDLKNDGYYKAYRQFRENKIEELVPNKMKAEYETDIIKHKYNVQ